MARDAYSASIESGDLSLLARYRAVWSALCNEGPVASITYRPEWAECFLKVHDPDPAIALLVVRRGDTVRGILPMRIRRYGIGPLAIRRALPPANYDTWEFDIIHGASDRDAVVAAALDCLRRWRGYDVLQVLSAEESGAIAALHAHWPAPVTHTTEYSYRIPCPPAGSSLAETIEHSCLNRKRQMHRHLRKMEAEPGLDRRRFDRDAGVPAVLAATERYIALELSGWKGARTDVLLDPHLQAYYRELARRGILVVHEIWFGADLAASHLGVMDGERMLALRIAYDERFAGTSPGQMLTLLTVKDAGDRGCRHVDLGGTSPSGTSYKTIWTDQWHPVGPYTLFAPTFRGRLLYLGLHTVRPAAGRLKARLRARLRRED